MNISKMEKVNDVDVHVNVRKDREVRGLEVIESTQSSEC